MNSVVVPSPALVPTTMTATTGTDVSSTGTVAWGSPGNLTVVGDTVQASLGAGATSHYLEATGFGFAVPSGSTILGIEVSFDRQTIPGAGPPTYNVIAAGIYLLQGGVVVGPYKPNFGLWDGTASYGGPADLWATAWTPAQINASNFGVALSAKNLGAVTETASVSGGSVAITVYYALASGFTIAQDAVVYAGQSAEIGSNYAWRTPNGTNWGPVGSYMGQYMKVPSPVHYDGVDDVLVKASRNALTGADAGIDAIQAQVSITPRYAQVPDA